MKNLLLVLLFVLPTALFSASPSCLAGTEVSLVDPNGKIVKTGKFDNKGQLNLDGLEDVVYDIRLTKNGKSCDLKKPKSGTFSGLPTGKRQHKPINFRLSDQKDGNNIVTPRDPASGLSTGRRQHSKLSAGNDGVDQDCDDVELRISPLGNGKVNIQDISITK